MILVPKIWDKGGTKGPLAAISSRLPGEYFLQERAACPLSPPHVFSQGEQAVLCRLCFYLKNTVQDETLNSGDVASWAALTGVTSDPHGVFFHAVMTLT